MKKQIIIAFLIALVTGTGSAQFGIGASGGLIYPGFAKSDNFGSQFGVGAGFDIFMRHRLISISDSAQIVARYSYRNYFSDINLPNVQTTRFKFTYLSLGATIVLYRFDFLQVYGGGGLSLVTGNIDKDEINETISTLLPEIIVGVELPLSHNYNLFSEVDFQFGTLLLETRNYTLPVHGFRLVIGGTMFLTE